MKSYSYIIPLLILSAACLNCHGGEYKYPHPRRRRNAGSSCKSCPTGRYKILSIHTDQYCDLCESGRYQDQEGESNCKGDFKCLPGNYGSVGSKTSTDAVCKACSAGYYSPSNGMESCGACPSGRFTDSLEQSTCKGGELCPTGKWLEGGLTSQHNCKECDVNKYSDTEGSLSCKNCPNGKYGEKNGAADCTSEPSCDRWYLLNKVSHTCYEIYNMTLYRILIGLYWGNVIIGMIAMCGNYTHKTVMCMQPYMFIIYFILFGVSIWLTTPAPINLRDGMTDLEYCICLAIIVTAVGVNIAILLRGNAKNSTTNPV